MADEPNIPTHRWYQLRNHIALRPDEVSATIIKASAIDKIDAHIAAFQTFPGVMDAPSLTGGIAGATLTLASAPSDGNNTITSYDYQVDIDGADFLAPLTQGSRTPAELAAPFLVAPLPAAAVRARSRAVNGIGPGPWSAPSAVATVTV